MVVYIFIATVSEQKKEILYLILFELHVVAFHSWLHVLSVIGSWTYGTIAKKNDAKVTLVNDPIKDTTCRNKWNART